MALFASVSANPLSLTISTSHPPRNYTRFSPSFASISPSSPSSSKSHDSSSPTDRILSSNPSSKVPFVEPSKLQDKSFNYPLANPHGNPVLRFMRATESSIERVIFDFRFLALFAVAGSLAGSLLCFLNGCVYIVDAYKVYWSSCAKGIHTGKMVLRLVEAIEDFAVLKNKLQKLLDSSSSPTIDSPANLIQQLDFLLNTSTSLQKACLTYTEAIDLLRTFSKASFNIFDDPTIKSGFKLVCENFFLTCPSTSALRTPIKECFFWIKAFEQNHNRLFGVLCIIDVYLAGTVMLIFGMGLYGLFISNVPADSPPSVDRALKGSSLFGMFALKERPKWMKISSLDELKTKVGHVIVMILLVKMFERSKMVTIATGLDLLSYSVCIFLSSASLYILHNLHKSD